MGQLGIFSVDNILAFSEPSVPSSCLKNAIGSTMVLEAVVETQLAVGSQN